MSSEEPKLLTPADFIKGGKKFDAVAKAVKEREQQETGAVASLRAQQDWSAIANKVVGAEGIENTQ